MGRLTTHVLDTARGRPGAGIDVRLFSLANGRHLVAAATTGPDGRTDKPLLDDSTYLAGSYELEFLVGDYFAAAGAERGEPPFLDEVVIRVTLGNDGHYHVPLLVSPWSYTTYRGS